MQDSRLPSSPSAVGFNLDGRFERRMLFTMLAAALVLRIALGSFVDASGFDTDLMQSWTRTLLNAPLDQFYAVAEGPDHLPGDLWFLWAIGHGLELIGLDNAPRGPFVVMMKLVPAIADVVIAWELFLLMRWFATSRAALVVAGAFAFNPGGIFLTSIWGQWDAVSMAMLLGGVLIVLRALSPPVGQPRHPERSVSAATHSHHRHPERSDGSPREAHPTSSDHDAGDTRSAALLVSPAYGLHAQPGSDPPGSGDPSKAMAEPSSGRGPSSLRSLGMTAGEALRGAADVPRAECRLRPLARRRLRRGILRFAQDDIGERRRGQGQTGPDGTKWTIPLWPAAVPLLTWAVLIKPPLALVAGVFMLYACVRTLQGASAVRDAVRKTAIAVVLSSILGIATASLILLPFDVGLPGMPTRWMVLERARYALDLYPFTTLQAANIWMIKDAHLYRPSDTDGTLLGLTERGWGSLLLTLALVWIAAVVIVRWRVIRVLDVPLLIWAALATSYAIFMLPTRVHERYFFPVMVLALAFSGLPTIVGPCERAGADVHGCWFARLRRGPGQDQWTWLLACTISAIFLVSLLVAYTPTVNAIRATLFDVPLAFLFRTLAIVNLGVFLITMTLPLWWRMPAQTSR